MCVRASLLCATQRLHCLKKESYDGNYMAYFFYSFVERKKVKCMYRHVLLHSLLLVEWCFTGESLMSSRWCV